jgi:Flp pilus assembly protein TadG
MVFLLPSSLPIIGIPLTLRIHCHAKKRLVIRTARRLFAAITRISRDTGGASAAIVAIALPVLIGFGALGAETGVWFTIKLGNQSATDAAAIAAAYEVIAGKTNITTELTPAASEAALRDGYKGTTPAVIYPYSDTFVSNGIAVTLQQTVGALLASMFVTQVRVGTKAVAVIEVLDNPCILALGASGTDLEIQPSTHLGMPNCSAAANSIGASAIALYDSTSSITAATLITAGEVSLQGSPVDPTAPPPELVLASPAMIGTATVADPYAGTLTHAFLTAGMPTTSTGPHSWKNVTKTIYPGLYDKGMSFQANAVIDLIPGVYYVTNGNFSVSLGATVKCSTCTGANGVTIVLTTNGGTVAVQISPGATVSLQAPSSGRFSGILFVQDPLAVSSGSTTPDNAFEAGASMKLTGLLYFPQTTVAFQGNPGAACALLVAKRVVIEGDSNFTTAGCSSAGLATLPIVNTIALAE